MEKPFSPPPTRDTWHLEQRRSSLTWCAPPPPLSRPPRASNRLGAVTRRPGSQPERLPNKEARGAKAQHFKPRKNRFWNAPVSTAAAARLFAARHRRRGL